MEKRVVKKQNAFFSAMKSVIKGNVLFAVIAVVLIIAAWTIAFFAVEKPLLVPSPLETFERLFGLFREAVFWKSFLSTILRVFWAFLICLIFGAFFGVISYLCPVFEKVFAPITSFLRSVPTLAITLLILLWTTPKTAPVIVAFTALFPMLYTAIYTHLSKVDRKLIDVCKVYEVPLSKQITKLFLPSVLPALCKEGAAAFAFALKLIVSAEVLSNTFLSIGGMMQEAAYYLDTATLFAYVIVVFFVGLLVETLGAFLFEKIGGKRDED